jgi:hypothetical protein
MSKIGISLERGVHIKSLGTSSLEEVERQAQEHAEEFKVPCNPAWDSDEVIRERTKIIAQREYIGRYVRVGENQWQHEAAIAAAREGMENTYAIYSDREIAMKHYSIDE